jgi:hypothetical protein
LRWREQADVERFGFHDRSPTRTIGGSREIDTRLLAVRPRYSSLTRALIMTTPAGSRAITSRKWLCITCAHSLTAQVGAEPHR